MLVPDNISILEGHLLIPRDLPFCPLVAFFALCNAQAKQGYREGSCAQI